MLFVPLARLVRQLTQRVFSQAVTSLLLHSISKKRVVAIPLPGSIKRFQKEIGSIQGFEELFAIAPAGDSITKRTCQAAKDTGLQEKSL